MVPERRSRPENDQLEGFSIRKAYKATLAPSVRFTFTIRNPHSMYISQEFNENIKSLALVKELAFHDIELKPTKYISDVVLYVESQKELEAFYKALIGSEIWSELVNEYNPDIHIEDEQEQQMPNEEMTRRYNAINLMNSGLSRALVCKALKISLNKLKYYVSLANNQKLDPKPKPKKLSQHWYDELSLYLSSPLRRHSSLREIKKALCTKLNQPLNSVAEKTIARMIKK